MKKNIRNFRQDLLRASSLLWKVDKQVTMINMGLQAVQALLPVVSLYYMKAMLEAVTQRHGAFDSILPLIIAFGSVQFLIAVIGQYASYINSVYQEKLTDYLSSEVLMKAVEVDYEYYENPAYHDTLHLAQQQSASRVAQLFTNFNSIILNSFSLVFLIGYFYTLHSLFALFFMLLSIPLAVVKWYSGFALITLQRKFAPIEREANYLHQVLTGTSSAKEVRVFGFGHFFIEKFRAIRLHILREKRKTNLKFTAYSLATEAIEIIIMAIVFGILAKQTWENTITIGAFVIYIQGFQRLQGTSKSFLQSVVQLFQQRLFLRDIFNFFDIETKSDSTGSQQFPVPAKGLSVSNVSFTYPQTQRTVLHDISLTCEPGKIIAIVGENGSGKSTLVKLLARLYTVQKGSICIGKSNINEIAQIDYRKNTIFLFQDFERYFFTITENIALGESDTEQKMQQIKDAATLSGAHPFISKLSEGYGTRMGRLFKGSEQLSGGQWQKLALSRIFYKDAKLVILDEPTSALDATAEYELYRNVKGKMKDKMVILITHRLYNLKIADHVYLMEDGRIKEEGSFDALIEKGGMFSQMYEAQKL